MRIFCTAFLAALVLQGCADDEASIAEIKQAAEELVRDKFNLNEQLPLQTRAFVGREHDGKPVLCVRVDGTSEAGIRLPTQHLISSGDPQRWLLVGSLVTRRDTKTDMFAEWSELCPEPAASA